MSLLVWLPFNGSTKNQGVAGNNFTAYNIYNAYGKVTNNCYWFNGSNSSVRGEVKLTPYMTFACWIKFDTTTLAHIIDCRDSNGTGYQPLYGGISANYGIQVYSSRGGSYIWDNSICGFTTGVWYHLAVTIDTDGATLYINGVSKGKYSASYGYDFGSRVMTVGTRFSSTNWFEGSINDVRVYDHILSTKEIKDLARGLCLHYRLNFEDLYEPIEYIQSTGTQRVKLNLTPKSTYKIESTFAITDTTKTSSIWCARGTSTGSYTTTAFYIANSGVRCDYGISATMTSIGSLVANTKHTLTMNKNVWYLDGVQKTSMAASTYTAGSPIQLFASHYNGIDSNLGNYSYMKLYKFKVYDENGVLVLSLVPCIRRTDYVAGLYDIINDVFYTNNGSGSFQVPTSAQYIPVDYIEFTGTQYIDSGVKTLNASNFNIRIDYQRTNIDNADACLFGQRQFGKFTNMYNTYYESAYGNTYSGSANDYNRNVVLMTDTGIYKNGEQLLSGTISSISSSYSALIGAFSEDSGANAKWFYKGKMYRLTINSGGALVRDFTPCIREADGVAGLFDNANNIFYPNNGSGTFGVPTTSSQLTVPDNSGYGNTGVCKSACSATNATPLGNASLVCPSTGVCVPFTTPMTQYTIAMWFKLGATGKMPLGSNTTTSSNTNFYCYGDMSWRYVTSAGGQEYYYSHNGGEVSTTDYVFWVATYDGATTKIYRNGVYEGSQTVTTSGATVTFNSISVGFGYNNSTYWTTNEVADFKLYSTALSENDIVALYKCKEMIDNKANIYCNVYSSFGNRLDFSKKSIVRSNEISESAPLGSSSTKVSLSKTKTISLNQIKEEM